MKRKGSIEVICGSMFSGKSEKLIRKIRRYQIAKFKTQVFKHAIDDRYSSADVVSHDKLSIEAIPVSEATEILNHLSEETAVVGIDEAEFFGPEIVDVCQTLADRGMHVIVAGLDQDFRGEPFGYLPELLSVAEKVEKLQAVCMVCNGTASRSQRLIDGNPAHYNDRTVMLGGKETYEARCRACHEVPGHPGFDSGLFNSVFTRRNLSKHFTDSTNSKKLIAIAGNIGAGKSTLTTLLCKQLGWKPFYEVVEDANHYLEDFYKDKARYGFALQVFFLSKRFKHLQETKEISESAIFDRTIYEDRFIFAQNLFNRGEISERDWNNYSSLFSIMEPFLPKPDLIIYLNVPPEVAFARIKERDRKEEKDMIPIEYLRQLDDLYTNWVKNIDFSPVLHIDGTKYDPRTNLQHLEEITNMVKEIIYPTEVSTPEPAHTDIPTDTAGVLCSVNV